MLKEVHVLNLGAGVQSTKLYLDACDKKLPCEVAIFADTQEEPEEVYRHLAWLKTLHGPPILERSAGKLGEDLKHGRNSRGGQFIVIPAYTTADGGATHGRTKRQCSKDYKLDVIDRAIRYDVLGLKPRQRIPKNVTVHHYVGISWDERQRAARIYERFDFNRGRRIVHFPLVESMTTRANIIQELAVKSIPHEVPRSACVFCPFHTDSEWQRLKERNGADWTRACEIDAALRNHGSVVNRDVHQTMYLHPSCKPLTEIDFRPRSNVKEQQLGFALECEGVCGV